jgi:hypothetical protein
MSSKACVDDLIAWTSANYDEIPKGDWNFVGEERLKVLAQGHTRSRNWKRRAKKQHGDLTFRLFECSQTLFDLSVMFLVIEEKDNLTATIKLGTRKEFEKYFDSVGYNWGGWSK